MHCDICDTDCTTSHTCPLCGVPNLCEACAASPQAHYCIHAIPLRRKTNYHQGKMPKLKRENGAPPARRGEKSIGDLAEFVTRLTMDANGGA